MARFRFATASRGQRLVGTANCRSPHFPHAVAIGLGNTSGCQSGSLRQLVDLGPGKSKPVEGEAERTHPTTKSRSGIEPVLSESPEPPSREDGGSIGPLDAPKARPGVYAGFFLPADRPPKKATRGPNAKRCARVLLCRALARRWSRRVPYRPAFRHRHRQPTALAGRWANRGALEDR